MTGGIIVALILIAIALAGRPPRPPRMAGLVLALLSSWMAQPARAEQPADGVFGSAKLSSWTWVQYVSSEGKDRVPSFGARLQGSASVWRLTLAGRLDASGRSEGVNTDNPRTYSSLEGYVLGAVDVVGPVALAGVWGVTRPTMGDTGPEQQTWGGGLLVGDGTAECWALVMVGRHEGAGEGLRPLIAFQAPLRDRTSLVGDAVLGRGWQVRAGVAVRLR